MLKWSFWNYSNEIKLLSSNQNPKGCILGCKSHAWPLAVGDLDAYFLQRRSQSLKRFVSSSTSTFFDEGDRVLINLRLTSPLAARCYLRFCHVKGSQIASYGKCPRVAIGQRMTRATMKVPIAGRWA
jgi:hypothetical protein